MTSHQSEHKELRPEARATAEQLVNEFSDSLHLQAKMISDQDGDEVVLTRHVKDAFDVIRRKYKQKYNVNQEVSLMVWSAALGIAAETLVSELLSQTTRDLVVAAAVSFLIVSLIMIVRIFNARSQNN